jgi:hypothetical protein
LVIKIKTWGDDKVYFAAELSIDLPADHLLVLIFVLILPASFSPLCFKFCPFLRAHFSPFVTPLRIPFLFPTVTPGGGTSSVAKSSEEHFKKDQEANCFPESQWLKSRDIRNDPIP